VNRSRRSARIACGPPAASGGRSATSSSAIGPAMSASRRAATVRHSIRRPAPAWKVLSATARCASLLRLGMAISARKGSAPLDTTVTSAFAVCFARTASRASRSTSANRQSASRRRACPSISAGTRTTFSKGVPSSSGSTACSEGSVLALSVRDAATSVARPGTDRPRDSENPSSTARGLSAGLRVDFGE